MIDGLEMYREVKSLEKNIEEIQLELANMQRHLSVVLQQMATEHMKKEEKIFTEREIWIVQLWIKEQLAINPDLKELPIINKKLEELKHVR